MDYFGYDISSFVPCEWCGKRSQDLHHIKARGMGGDPQGKKDVISNLACLCRSCHYKLDFSMELSKEFVQECHNKKLRNYGMEKH
jgi:hypothetical protein